MELYYQRLKKFEEQVSIYPVSCEALCGGRSDRQWLDAVLTGGAKVVQLRDKASSDAALLEKARYFRQKTREADALFLVNDRLDIGLLAEADGIHVGSKDLPPEEIRRLAPDFIIGLSCNNEQQVRELGDKVRRGESAISYYNIGPLYQTETKEDLQSFLGSAAIQRFSSLCSAPFTVMGGIKLEHVGELVKAGAKRIAVVTAISQAEDIIAETDLWIKTIKAAGNELG